MEHRILVSTVMSWAIRCYPFVVSFSLGFGPCQDTDLLASRMCTLEYLCLLVSYRFFVNLRIINYRNLIVIVVTIVDSFANRHSSLLESNLFCVRNCVFQFASLLFDLFEKWDWIGLDLSIDLGWGCLLEYPSRNLNQFVVCVVDQWIGYPIVDLTDWVHPELVCLGNVWHLSLEHLLLSMPLSAQQSHRRWCQLRILWVFVIFKFLLIVFGECVIDGANLLVHSWVPYVSVPSTRHLSSDLEFAIEVFSSRHWDYWASDHLEGHPSSGLVTPSVKEATTLWC